MDYTDNIDAPKTKFGKVISGAGLKFLTDIMDAKESGQKLPGLLDKIATLALKGKAAGVNVAKEATVEETKKKFPWLIVAVLAVVLIIVLIRRR